jgi:hypothetical protein
MSAEEIIQQHQELVNAHLKQSEELARLRVKRDDLERVISTLSLLVRQITESIDKLGPDCIIGRLDRWVIFQYGLYLAQNSLGGELPDSCEDLLTHVREDQNFVNWLGERFEQLRDELITLSLPA